MGMSKVHVFDPQKPPLSGAQTVSNSKPQPHRISLKAPVRRKAGGDKVGDWEGAYLFCGSGV
eukprot:1206275-Amorphochlora_amoeboformis.AAC.1